jgi:hypothetical protein
MVMHEYFNIFRSKFSPTSYKYRQLYEMLIILHLGG